MVQGWLAVRVVSGVAARAEGRERLLDMIPSVGQITPLMTTTLDLDLVPGQSRYVVGVQ